MAMYSIAYIGVRNLVFPREIALHSARDGSK